ncbi:serine protease gd-like [Scaptodrosophila lebanonensis]|uniref:Serine protease gd-like n=1 Tax=Drosophila lebanonensis TaxID=7225 RepID=A0A6J2T2U9_DROLE|nr:serine protease gd-like [Scaptodrosophila lebanonensis]
MRKLWLLSGLLLMLRSEEIFAQNVPHIACPQYFEYLAFNQEYIGRLTLPHDPRYGNNTIFVEFSQRTPINSAYVGRLSLLQDEETTKYNLANGIPIQYRVDFPTPGVLPKLTQIYLNNAVICYASPYPPPNTLISLTHTLRFQASPLRGNSNTITIPVRPAPARPQATQPPQIVQRPAQQSVIVQPSFQQQPQPQPAPIPATAAPRQRPTAITNQAQLNAVCGRETPTISPFIFHGTNVAHGKLPWMAAIFEKQTNGLVYFCGGTLLSQSTVVSAAHCFRLKNNLPASRTIVSLGRVSLDDYKNGVLSEIEVIVQHEEYQSDNFSDADIALLKLVERVTFTEFIKPICLWNENYRLDLPTGEKSYVAGWGADQDGNANTKIAKMTDTDILSESDCLRRLPTRRVTPRTICAENKVGAGPCTGDSGSGLMLNENNVWVLRGIVSAGQTRAQGCDLSKPVIYCDLAKHIQWVRASMWY